jgi:hypothetical protein
MGGIHFRIGDLPWYLGGGELTQNPRQSSGPPCRFRRFRFDQGEETTHQEERR